MDELNLKKSVVLIGPKAIGKTLIASKLLGFLDGYEIFGSDALENYVIMFLKGDFRSIDQIKSIIKSEFSDEKVLGRSKSKNSEEIVRKNQEFVSEYIKSLDFFGKYVDFFTLKRMVRQTINIIANNELSFNERLFIMQYKKIQLIKEAMENINVPVIFDLGADLGAVIELSENEQYKVSLILDKSFQELNAEQIKFFKQFENIIYLEPGADYKGKLEKRSNDLTNLLYMQSEKSYIDFASFMVSVNGLFYNQKHKAFYSDEDFDFDSLVEKERLIDASNLKNICEQIIGFLKIEKEMMN